VATADRREHLRVELGRVDVELARYADAIADAGPLDTIVQAIKIREERRQAIRAELRTLAPAKPGEVDAPKIRCDTR
jgi:hypothetical protein